MSIYFGVSRIQATHVILTVHCSYQLHRNHFWSVSVLVNSVLMKMTKDIFSSRAVLFFLSLKSLKVSVDLQKYPFQALPSNHALCPLAFIRSVSPLQSQISRLMMMTNMQVRVGILRNRMHSKSFRASWSCLKRILIESMNGDSSNGHFVALFNRLFLIPIIMILVQVMIVLDCSHSHFDSYFWTFVKFNYLFSLWFETSNQQHSFFLSFDSYC